MTDNRDGFTLDLTTSTALAQSAAADFAEIEQYRTHAFERLSAYLAANKELEFSLWEAYLDLAEHVGADPDLFGTIIGRLAAGIAHRVDEGGESAEDGEASGELPEGVA